MKMVFRRARSVLIATNSTVAKQAAPALVGDRARRLPRRRLPVLVAKLGTDTNFGTAVVLYRIARRQNETLAIGYVAARIIECVFIAAGIIFVLGVVSLRQDSPDAADLAVSLAQLKDWTFLFGPGLVVPFGNGLILGYLMYKSGLVPRRMAWLGLIGGPLLLIGNIGVLFDLWDQTGLVSVLVVPEFIWEAFLGIYCAVRGFRKDSPIVRPNWRGHAAA